MNQNHVLKRLVSLRNRVKKLETEKKCLDVEYMVEKLRHDKLRLVDMNKYNYKIKLFNEIIDKNYEYSQVIKELKFDNEKLLENIKDLQKKVDKLKQEQTKLCNESTYYCSLLYDYEMLMFQKCSVDEIRFGILEKHPELYVNSSVSDNNDIVFDLIKRLHDFESNFNEIDLKNKKALYDLIQHSKHHLFVIEGKIRNLSLNYHDAQSRVLLKELFNDYYSLKLSIQRICFFK